MLTTAQVEYCTTFGFAVLRGFLADRAAALRGEVDAAIRDAYAATYDDRVVDGISGHYLPMAADPVDDPLVVGGGISIADRRVGLGAQRGAIGQKAAEHGKAERSEVAGLSGGEHEGSS